MTEAHPTKVDDILENTANAKAKKSAKRIESVLERLDITTKVRGTTETAIDIEKNAVEASVAAAQAPVLKAPSLMRVFSIGH